MPIRPLITLKSLRFVSNIAFFLISQILLMISRRTGSSMKSRTWHSISQFSLKRSLVLLAKLIQSPAKQHSLTQRQNSNESYWTLPWLWISPHCLFLQYFAISHLSFFLFQIQSFKTCYWKRKISGLGGYALSVSFIYASNFSTTTVIFQQHSWWTSTVFCENSILFEKSLNALY